MHGIDKKRGHNMLALMLDPKYKKYMCSDYLFGSWKSYHLGYKLWWTIVNTSIVGGKLQGQMMPIKVDNVLWVCLICGLSRLF
jgi:hypothetical protein